MAERAIVALKTLRCIKQNDEVGPGSELYVWPFLAGLATAPTTFQSTPPAGTTAAAPKLVFSNNLGPGGSAPLPAHFSTLQLDFKPNQRDHQLILAVALLENDFTNVFAAQAGQVAFNRALKRMAGRYLEYLASNPEDATPIALDIADDAGSEAMKAMAAKMSQGELAQFRDDLLGIAIRGFRKPLAHGSRDFVLTFDSPGNRFTIEGSLSFRNLIQNPGHGPTEGPNQPLPSG